MFMRGALIHLRFPVLGHLTHFEGGSGEFARGSLQLNLASRLFVTLTFQVS